MAQNDFTEDKWLPQQKPEYWLVDLSVLLRLSVSV